MIEICHLQLLSIGPILTLNSKSQSESRIDALEPGLKSRGFTLVELMIVVFLISIFMSMSLPIYIDRLDRAKVVSLFPYAKTNMEYLMGYHSIYGDWPNEVPNPFNGADAEAKNPMLSLMTGDWPKEAPKFENEAVWIEGSVSTHDGSFLMTSNVIDRYQQDTVSFYLQPILHDGLPGNFVWNCAFSGAADQALPNPTTVDLDDMPRYCRQTKDSIDE